MKSGRRKAGVKTGAVGRGRVVLAVLAILLVASNLRAPITSVGPLLGEIQAGLGFSAGAAGLLTALPLLAFAAVSPLAPRIARRVGVGRTLFAALAVLAAGVALRSAAVPAALFGGTLVVGLAIAFGNVLLPGLVKRDLPEHTGLVTGLYAAVMGACAALASGVSVPLAEAAGWRWSLAFWAVPALIAAALWAPRARAAPDPPSTPGPPTASYGLLGSPLAWQVTLFMGLQSAVFYASITWVPAIVRSGGGLDAAQAGWMVSLMQFVAIPATLGAPLLAQRSTSQQLVLSAASGLSAAGLLGLLFGAPALPAVLVLGLGHGACISLALSLFALRAPDAEHAARLSSMGQSLGYLLAAASPPLFGALHDLTGSWDLPLVGLLAVTACLAASGLGAGRDLQVGRPSRREG